MKTIGHIHPRHPYNFDLTCSVIARFPHPTTDVIGEDGAYWRVVRVGGVLVLVRVTAADGSMLRVQQVAANGEVDAQTVVGQVVHLLSTDLDMTPFYDFSRTQAALWQVVEPIVGLRWLRTETAYEALMTTIIEQQIAWRTAQRAQRWLVEWGGHSVTHDGRAYYVFPTPAQIAAATVDDLKPLKITFRRMATLIDVSQWIVNRDFDVEGLRNLPHADAYDALIKLKGIGHWTAAWTLQRMHGVQNTVGHNDVALQAAVNRYFYGGEGRIPAEQVQATYAPFGEFAGLAAHHTILRWVIDNY